MLRRDLRPSWPPSPERTRSAAPCTANRRRPRCAPPRQRAPPFTLPRTSSSKPFAHAEVVALGISTGGPKALTEMLPRLRGDFPVPMLIVQHMPPVFTKSLADDLNARCKMRVYEAVDGQQVLPGVALIAPGGKQMKVYRDADRVHIRHHRRSAGK